jgi:cytochrome c peroxidase
MHRHIIIAALVLTLVACFAAPASADPTAASVGEKLFFDTNLSNPIGQSCADCHAPAAGFADPASQLPVSAGAVLGRFGNRNAPSAAYMKAVPPRTYSEELGTYIGGLFWDGRVDSLEAQAKGPFLNPLEMHMSQKQAVVARVADSAYADEFRAVFGPDSLSRSSKNVDQSYDTIASAIAAYERSEALNPFTSKHDLAMSRFGPARMQTFTMQERQGMMLFNNMGMGMMGGKKANCSTCHVTPMEPGTPPPWVVADEVPFTDHRYANLGLPKNWESPYLGMVPAFNPEGLAYIDHGLAAVLDGGVVANGQYDGMFRTPSLRNVALTAPYGHNGYFKTLKEIVHYYNTRDVPGAGWNGVPWPEPEVPSTMDTALMGNLGLSDADEDAIVAFLLTLTDGYWQRP